MLPSRSHSFNGSYYDYNYDKQRNISIYGGLTLTDDAIVYVTTLDTTGARTTSYINRNNSLSSNLGGSWSKQFKKTQKWQIALRNNTYGNFRRGTFYLNDFESIQSNYGITSTQNVNFNYNSVISFNTNYSLNASLTKYKPISAITEKTKVNLASVNTLKHTVGTDVTIRWPSKMIFDAKYGFSFNPQVARGFPKSSHIVNMAVTLLMLEKDRGQVKLSVYDLLDQNISVSRYAGNNSISTNEQQILKRYFLINFQYKISSYK